MNEVEDFRAKTLARQAEAEAAFHQGDPGPRMELWSRRDPVTLFGAAGMYKSGWDELSRILRWAASRRLRPDEPVRRPAIDPAGEELLLPAA